MSIFLYKCNSSDLDGAVLVFSEVLADGLIRFSLQRGVQRCDVIGNVGVGAVVLIALKGQGDIACAAVFLLSRA